MDDEALPQILLRLDGTIDRALTAFERERFWRKVSGVLMVLGFLSLGLFVSYSRQADCDRTNAARARLPAAIAAGFGTAWDSVGPPDDPQGRAALVDEVRTDVRVMFPPRDCSWPA